MATPPRPEGARSSVSDDASARFRGDFFGRFFFVANLNFLLSAKHITPRIRHVA
jgi:hypothetical protein